MPSSPPPLDTRITILSKWRTTGTVRDIARRVGGMERPTLNAAREWASLHGYIANRPPNGYQITSAGQRWLHRARSGDSGDEPGEAYMPPEAPPQRRVRPRRIFKGSAFCRALEWLNTHGSECAAELSTFVGINPKRTREVCRVLKAAGYIAARPENRTVRTPHGPQTRPVYVYSITQDGREALKESA